MPRPPTRHPRDIVAAVGASPTRFANAQRELPHRRCILHRGHRWQVELFFKWIKQHLRIKSFFGTSENAVRTQIWIAVTVYVLVAVLRKRLGISADLYTISCRF